MDNAPRQKLKELIRTYGQALCRDTEQCESLLNGFYEKELFILSAVLKTGIVEELLTPRLPVNELLLLNLTRKLQEKTGLTEEAALWGVESWMQALGLAEVGQVPGITAEPVDTGLSESREQDGVSSAEVATSLEASDETQSTSIVLETTAQQSSKLSKMPLYLFWIIDCATSKNGTKMKQVDYAVSEAIPHLQAVAQEHPDVQILVRALAYSGYAEWCVGEPTPIEKFQWHSLNEKNAYRDTGQVLSVLSTQVRIPPLSGYGLPPVFILFTDGRATDDFYAGYDKLMLEPWGKNSIRIGMSFNYLQEVLPEIKLFSNQPILKIHNSAAIAKFIKFTPITASKLT